MITRKNRQLYPLISNFLTGVAEQVIDRKARRRVSSFRAFVFLAFRLSLYVLCGVNFFGVFFKNKFIDTPGNQSCN
jgi:hypothetical protein